MEQCGKFKLVKTSPVGSDYTAGYRVYMNEPLTIQEFIDCMIGVNSGDWGSITIRDFHSLTDIYALAHYEKGHLKDEIPHAFLDMKIKEADASGGWSRMDYILSV